MSKIIAVDFDGTLFTEEYPNIGKPKWRVINWCKERQAKGDILILWTCREGEYLREAIEMCKEVGLVFDYVNENVPLRTKRYGNDCRKIGADIYLDDKAMRPEEIRMCERCEKCKHFVIEEFVVFDESGEACDEALEYYCNKKDDYITPSCCEGCNGFEEEEQ